MILLFFTKSVFAMQYAIVRNRRSVIYSDYLRTSPIGYVRKGRKVRVGSVSRNKGRVLPIVVSGKIAYISVSDLSILDGSEVLLPKGHDSIIGLEIRKRKFVFGTDYFVSNFTQGQYSIGQVEEKTVALTGFTLKKEKRKKPGSFQRYGLEMLSFSNEDEKLQIPSLVYDWVGNIYENGRLKIRSVFGLGFSPYAIFRVDPYFALNGFSAHTDLGLESIVYLFERHSLIIKTTFRAQQLLDFNLPSPFSEFSPLIAGGVISASFAYSY